MLEQEGALTPHAVIEDIRSGEYLLDVDGESAKVRRGARSLQEKLNRTLKLLSEDLYSKTDPFHSGIDTERGRQRLRSRGPTLSSYSNCLRSD